MDNLQITQWTHKSNLRVIDVLGDDLSNLLIRIQAVRRIRDVPKVPNLPPLVVQRRLKLFVLRQRQRLVPIVEERRSVRPDIVIARNGPFEVERVVSEQLVQNTRQRGVW